MATKSSVKKSSKRKSSSSAGLSPRTKKAIDTLPSHAQHIYTKAHKNALKQYKSLSKKRGAGSEPLSLLYEQVRSRSRGLR